MSDVRAVSTVPIVADFGSSTGSPICIDVSTGKAYILNSAGEVQQIGTLADGTGRWAGGVDTSDFIIIDSPTAGFVLRSNDGTYWKITITNTGNLNTSALGARP